MKKQWGDVYWGLVLVAVGGVFLAKNLGYLELTVSWRLYWPVILILIGISFVVKTLERKGS